MPTPIPVPLDTFYVLNQCHIIAVTCTPAGSDSIVQGCRVGVVTINGAVLSVPIDTTGFSKHCQYVAFCFLTNIGHRLKSLELANILLLYTFVKETQ